MFSAGVDGRVKSWIIIQSWYVSLTLPVGFWDRSPMWLEMPAFSRCWRISEAKLSKVECVRLLLVSTSSISTPNRSPRWSDDLLVDICGFVMRTMNDDNRRLDKGDRTNKGKKNDNKSASAVVICPLGPGMAVFWPAPGLG
jgi:hypothetical protein